MKKMSVFHMTKRKKIKELIKQMDTIEVQYHRSQLKKIISQRKNKMRQMMNIKSYQQQPQFKPLKKDYLQFSTVEPLSKNDSFIPEKIRKKLMEATRAYSSSPNMKVGKADKLGKNIKQTQDKLLLNRKFLQYDKTIDQQSSIKKIQKLQKLKLLQFEHSKPKQNVMKKTYFQRFASDNFNFYDSNKYNSLKSSILSRSRTDRDVISTLKTSKLKRINSTVDTDSNEQKSLIGYLNKSRLNKSKANQFQSFKNQLKRSRLKTNSNSTLEPITIQKNLNSLEY